jgi:dynein heavy chain 2
VTSNDTNDSVIVFFKVRPEVITPDNMHSNVFMSSMLDSPISALYHAVQKVFAPILLKDEKWSRSFDPKLQNLLSELEAGLGSVMRKQDPNARGRGNEDENSFAGLCSICKPTVFSGVCFTGIKSGEISISETFF